MRAPATVLVLSRTASRWAESGAVHESGWPTRRRSWSPRLVHHKRGGRNIAAVAVARKLLTLVFYGLRDGKIRAVTQARKAAA